MQELFKVGQGTFVMQRLPLRQNQLLRAWDAADEYLLEHMENSVKPASNARILIINDSFGALSVGLAQYQPVAWSDSYLARQSTLMNLRTNALSEQSFKFVASPQTPDGQFDIVLIKAPKTLAFLEDLLLRLRPLLLDDTQIILAGMVKHLPGAVWTLLERIIGPTSNSLAKKKARLIFCNFDATFKLAENPYPSAYQLENSRYLITNHANVFSREQLDIGTRFFLEHLPVNNQAKTIVDLGCGNGVVGLMAAAKNPEAELHFVDESYMAVASAEQNFRAAFNGHRTAYFSVADGLENFTSASVDLILCNPPFHQQQTIGDHLAKRMFSQSYKTLKKDGELWIIGNRHLEYPVSLKKLFGNCVQIAANQKFIIIKARRTE